MKLTEDIFDHGPDPENPGWRHWNLKDQSLFNGAVMGRMITRVDGDGPDGPRARLRMFPERRHENLQGIVHGAVTLALIDISLFTTMHIIGTGNAGPSVTLELSTQFTGAGRPDRPLDAVTEIVRETGSLVFVRGKVEQGSDHVVASFSGIVRKMRPR